MFVYLAHVFAPWAQFVAGYVTVEIPHGTDGLYYRCYVYITKQFPPDDICIMASAVETEVIDQIADALQIVLKDHPELDGELIVDCEVRRV